MSLAPSHGTPRGHWANAVCLRPCHPLPPDEHHNVSCSISWHSSRALSSCTTLAPLSPGPSHIWRGPVLGYDNWPSHWCAPYDLVVVVWHIGKSPGEIQLDLVTSCLVNSSAMYDLMETKWLPNKSLGGPSLTSDKLAQSRYCGVWFDGDSVTPLNILVCSFLTVGKTCQHRGTIWSGASGGDRRII